MRANKSIILAFLFLFSSLSGLSQRYYPKKRKYKQKFEASTDLGLIIGGCTFMIAGALTNPAYKPPDYMTPKHILLQGPRTIAIFSGGILIIIGSSKLITK